MIIADTSGLLAFFNAREPAHDGVVSAVEANDGPLVISPFVIAELDYLVATRIGLRAERMVLEELASNAYELATISPVDLRRCVDIIDRYQDQEIGVTDASLVVLAERYGTNRVLTLDRRHFSVLRSAQGDAFELIGC